RVLWVDAICINQTDNDERSKQVAIMGEIYNRAIKVFAWLGEANGQSNCVLNVLQESQIRRSEAIILTNLTLLSNFTSIGSCFAKPLRT
ncbi:heterokaryon incompatibility protein-domain-containing protein, partial [Pyrenochaeta sp. MPI-SDFR-AT-0127]